MSGKKQNNVVSTALLGIESKPLLGQHCSKCIFLKHARGFIFFFTRRQWFLNKIYEWIRLKYRMYI
jgi:hypothetical protein